MLSLPMHFPLAEDVRLCIWYKTANCFYCFSHARLRLFVVSKHNNQLCAGYAAQQQQRERTHGPYYGDRYIYDVHHIK